jgi:NAD(P)H-dependent FMN reductase
VFDLDDIPLYNADLDMDGIRPYEVERLKKAIADADALLGSYPFAPHRRRRISTRHHGGQD